MQTFLAAACDPSIEASIPSQSTWGSARGGVIVRPGTIEHQKFRSAGIRGQKKRARSRSQPRFIDQKARHNWHDRDFGRRRRRRRVRAGRATVQQGGTHHEADAGGGAGGRQPRAGADNGRFRQGAAELELADADAGGIRVPRRAAQAAGGSIRVHRATAHEQGAIVAVPAGAARWWIPCGGRGGGSPAKAAGSAERAAGVGGRGAGQQDAGRVGGGIWNADRQGGGTEVDQGWDGILGMHIRKITFCTHVIFVRLCGAYINVIREFFQCGKLRRS